MASKGLSKLGLELCRSATRRQLIKKAGEIRMLTAEVSCPISRQYHSQGNFSSTVQVQGMCHIQQIRRDFSSHYDKWTELTYEDLVALLDSGDIQLFDVREPKEIEDTGSIPRAINIPLGDIKCALKMNDARFPEHFKVSKPQHHDTNIVFYGLGPIKSTAALEIAHKLGFKKARHYAGGYDEWRSKQIAKK